MELDISTMGNLPFRNGEDVGRSAHSPLDGTARPVAEVASLWRYRQRFHRK